MIKYFDVNTQHNFFVVNRTCRAYENNKKKKLREHLADDEDITFLNILFKVQILLSLLHT